VKFSPDVSMSPLQLKDCTDTSVIAATSTHHERHQKLMREIAGTAALFIGFMFAAGVFFLLGGMAYFAISDWFVQRRATRRRSHG
jgi:hypothetical protein